MLANTLSFGLTCLSALAMFGFGRVILKTGVDVQAAYIFSYPCDLTLTRASCLFKIYY